MQTHTASPHWCKLQQPAKSHVRCPSEPDVTLSIPQHVSNHQCPRSPKWGCLETCSLVPYQLEVLQHGVSEPWRLQLLHQPTKQLCWCSDISFSAWLTQWAERLVGVRGSEHPIEVALVHCDLVSCFALGSPLPLSYTCMVLALLGKLL